MEYKSFVGYTTKSPAQGVVEAIFSPFGVLDSGNDVTHKGAFIDTFRRHGSKVKVLDNHKAGSILDVVGKPLALKEVGRSDLPAAMRRQFPSASGGAYAKIQFLMDTPEGAGAYARVKEGLTEWSWGYDAIRFDYGNVAGKDGKKVRARHLRQVRLYEISPVLWGMAPTFTVSAKGQGRRTDLDLFIEIAQERREIEKLTYGGKTATQLLAEIYLEQEELAKLL